MAYFAKQAKAEYVARTESTLKRVHLVCAAIKAVNSWHAVETLQAARECCGGQGYLMRNVIAPSRLDADVLVTLDG